MKANVPLIESPFFYDELAKGNFTEEEKRQLTFYHENGYLIFNPKIEEELIDDINSQLSPLFSKIIVADSRLPDAWKKNENVRLVAVNKQIQQMLKLLYQRNPIPFQTINFTVGTQQKTHSDMIHFNSIPQRFMCGVWVAFEDIHPDNGPLHYYPGSHKMPFYDMIDIGVKGSKNTDFKKEMMSYVKDYETFIEKLLPVTGIKKATLNIKKGEAIIWSANLLHGGEKINTPGLSRNSQVTHYFFEDCIYYTPYLSDIAINKLYVRYITNLNTGKKMPNRYFNETVNPNYNRHLKNNILELLSNVSHFFPISFVEKMKKSIGK